MDRLWVHGEEAGGAIWEVNREIASATLVLAAGTQTLS